MNYEKYINYEIINYNLYIHYTNYIFFQFKLLLIPKGNISVISDNNEAEMTNNVSHLFQVF